MTFSYYPGCTLKTKGKELDIYARECANILGFTLEEIDNWQCCGAVYPMGTDEIATKLASVRALIAAKEKERPLVTLCSACHHVLKRVNDDMKNDIHIQTSVNNYLKDEVNDPYYGETEVIHFLEVIDKHITFEILRSKVINPLKDQQIGAYYGCLLLRPSTIMAFDDPENPSIFEKFISALGATPVIYSNRNECCGGYISLKEKERAKNMTKIIKIEAKEKGAQCLITACPLCVYNINKEESVDLPVHYFTKLLHTALKGGGQDE